MSRLIRCDRCDAVEPLTTRRRGWEMVSSGADDDPFDPLHAEAIDVCPDCLTPEERADFLIRDVAESVAADLDGGV